LEEQRKAREASLLAEKEHMAKIGVKPEELVIGKDLKTIQEERLAEEKRKLQEKVRSYARNVKEMYWPKVSEDKRQEMEHLKDPSLRQSILRLK